MSEDLGEQKMNTKDVACPFCEEKGFDMIGLKMHLIRGWCEVFEQTPDDFPKYNYKQFPEKSTERNPKK